MKLQEDMCAIVTGGVSGLGAATALRLLDKGLTVVALDLNEERGQAMESQYPGRLHFIEADVCDAEQVSAGIAKAEQCGNLRALVHCAGIGGAVRLVAKDGSAGSLERFTKVINVNLVGTYNVLRLVAAAMAKNEPVAGERGACVLTASVAGYEGQIGQIPYASSKAGVIGMTIVAARDLASKLIRVCTIAPGIFETPMLMRLPEKILRSLGMSVPNPSRLGRPEEFAMLARQILEDPMLNGETIRLDGAIRMQPR